MRFFFFGTLMDPDVMAAVIGRAPGHHDRRPAWLEGYRRVHVARETFPMLVPAPDRVLKGLLVDGITPADLDRIMFFESVEYESQAVEVLTADTRRFEARLFHSSEHAAAATEPWEFNDWSVRHKAQCLREATIWMGLFGHVDIAEADRLWDLAVAAGQPLDAMVQAVRRGDHRTWHRESADSA